MAFLCGVGLATDGRTGVPGPCVGPEAVCASGRYGQPEARREARGLRERPRRGLTEGVPEAKPPRHANTLSENFFRKIASEGRAPRAHEGGPRGEASASREHLQRKLFLKTTS
jgi:hypothetical protein